MKHNKNPIIRQGVTGRDGFIVAQALYWFIREQQELERTQPERFEWSNTEDAKALLRELFAGLVEGFVVTERACGRRPANIEPDLGEVEIASNVVTPHQ